MTDGTELSVASSHETLDSARILVCAAALLALWLAESLAPMYFAARDRKAHAARNLALGAINGLVASALLVAVTVAVVEVCRRADFGLLRWAEAPVLLGWLLALVALDGTHYLAHVAFHKTPLLWRIHAVHHHDADVDVTTAA